MRSGSRKKLSRAGSTSAQSRRSRARNRAAAASRGPASNRRTRAPTRWRWKSVYPTRSAWWSASMRAAKAASSASAIAISISSTIWRSGWVRTTKLLSAPRCLERLALLRIVQARIIVFQRLRRRDVERGEDRAVLFEDVRDLLLEHAQVGKVVGRGVARRARDVGEIHFRIWNRMAAVRLVGVVVGDEVNEIFWRCGRDGHQAAEIHQKAAIALQDDDAPVRPAERQAKSVRRIEPHGADRQIVERPRAGLDPVDGGAVGRDHRFVGDVAGQDAKTFVAFHHDALGLRPTKNATGCDSA